MLNNSGGWIPSHVVVALAFAVSAPPGAGAAEAGGIGSIEGFRAAVHEQTLDAARWIDSLFADEEYEAERTDASLRLRFDANLDEDGGSFSVRPRLRLHLPAANRRLMLELEGARETAVGEGGFDLGDLFDDSAEDDPLELRLRIDEDRGATRITPELGVGFDAGSPNAFAGLRVRRTWEPSDTWAFYASERLRAHTDIGLESITILRADRPFWGDSLLRADFRLDWLGDEPGFRYTPGLRLFRPLTDTSAVAFEVQAEFETEPTHEATRYVGGVRYRAQVLTDWTTVEIAPRITFDGDDDYAPGFGALLRLDVEF
jgi:hypothetical protein